MSSSSESAIRIELHTPSWRWHWAVGTSLLLCCGLAIGRSGAAPLGYALLPPLLWLYLRAGRPAATVLLLASNSDLVSMNQTNYQLHDHHCVADSVGLKLEDGKGMRISVLMGPWNSSTSQRRQARLWLARHGKGSDS